MTVCYIFYLKYCYAVFLPTSWLEGKNALFANVVLYLLCTALVNFTLQLQQVKAQLPEVHFQM